LKGGGGPPLNDRDQYLKIHLQQTKHQLNLTKMTNFKKKFFYILCPILNVKKFSFDDYLWKEKDNQGYTPIIDCSYPMAL